MDRYKFSKNSFYLRTLWLVYQSLIVKHLDF